MSQLLAPVTQWQSPLWCAHTLRIVVSCLDFDNTVMKSPFPKVFWLRNEHICCSITKYALNMGLLYANHWLPFWEMLTLCEAYKAGFRVHRHCSPPFFVISSVVFKFWGCQHLSSAYPASRIGLVLVKIPLDLSRNSVLAVAKHLEQPGWAVPSCLLVSQELLGQLPAVCQSRVWTGKTQQWGQARVTQCGSDVAAPSPKQAPTKMLETSGALQSKRGNGVWPVLGPEVCRRCTGTLKSAESMRRAPRVSIGTLPKGGNPNRVCSKAETSKRVVEQVNTQSNFYNKAKVHEQST